ncbi:YceH family protein [Conexibacter sp. CPCC 206217]|uniref:YceH family protein n=1 Tax=Conexibacter sp. CPCC 206217 TaxID=3064574 RepID=UPI00271FEF8A|nr:YceH family protein [Conexibacter sp. CPCC 206217]MDO8209872.1 YceH family protein [Conexibacter sp. CPCC 206217]
MDPDAVEIRVLGCLIEKQRTTPDAYPLSLNALRLACNQSTNRDPVVQYDEGVIRDALQHLYRRGWTRLTTGHGSRAAKYRHLLDETLHLRGNEISVLAVLMLRGPQTPGELKQRAERMHHFDDLGAVQATLEQLIERGHVARLERRPGQKEERYMQLLGGDQDETIATGPAAVRPVAAAPASAAATHSGAPVPAAAGAGAPAPRPAAAPSIPVPDAASRLIRLEREVADLLVSGDRLARLERDVAELRGGGERIAQLERELAELREQLATLRAALGE